jgi:Co/Zn/Cd efflux system component
MSIVAVVIFLAIGLLADWGHAFTFFLGYLVAFLVTGWMKYRGQI